MWAWSQNFPTRHTRELHSLAPSLSKVCLRPDIELETIIIIACRFKAQS